MTTSPAEVAARGTSVAATSAGDVVVAGAFAGRIDFGGGVLVSAAPPPPADAGALDAGVMFGGCSSGTFDCAPDAVVAKYDATGAHQWSHRYGAGDGDAASGVAIDKSGNVIVTGDFHDAVSFGGATLTAQGSGKSDAFVVKLDAAGDHVWSVALGGMSDDGGAAVAADANGDVVVAGFFAGTASFGQATLTSLGAYDGFVAKLDGASGNVLWAKRLGAGDRGQVAAVAVDASGAIFVAGAYRGGFDLGGGEVASIYADDAFVARLDGTGAYQWSKAFGADGDDEATSLALDVAGNVHVTGHDGSPRSVDFGGGPICGGDIYPGIFTVSLDPSGAHLCSRCYKASEEPSVRPDGSIGYVAAGGDGIAVSSAGDLVVGGGFGEALDVGAGRMVTTGGEDIFVASFAR
jgi:hypothetical protein